MPRRRVLRKIRCKSLISFVNGVGRILGFVARIFRTGNEVPCPEGAIRTQPGEPSVSEDPP
jgi:hypothetical protein